MEARRVTVIGIARAGSSMAEALARVGARVTVVDQKPADALAMIETIDRLRGHGIEVVTSWAGDLDWSETDLIAVSPGVPSGHPALREAVARGVEIWSEIEVAFRLSKAPIIAVTGTNGKSTVTALTWHILRQAGRDAVLCGNIAGSGLPEMPISTAASESRPDNVLVAEISSFQLEWVRQFRPAACTITRIAPDHLDRYAGFDQYAAAKKRIYENQTADDWAVVNLDRPETFDCEVRAKMLTYGREGEIQIADAGMDFEGGKIDIGDLWAGGRHNLENAAAACLLAHSQGVDLAEAAAHVRSFRGIGNRMEFVAERGGVRYVNNSMCTNPDALRASLQAATPPVILLAGGVNKVEDLKQFQAIDANRVKLAILYGRDAAQLDEALSEIGIRTQRADTLQVAFEVAQSQAAGGDSVLLSPGCASFDQFEDFIARGDCFKLLVRESVGEVKV